MELAQYLHLLSARWFSDREQSRKHDGNPMPILGEIETRRTPGNPLNLMLESGAPRVTRPYCNLLRGPRASSVPSALTPVKAGHPQLCLWHGVHTISKRGTPGNTELSQGTDPWETQILTQVWGTMRRSGPQLACPEMTFACRTLYSPLSPPFAPSSLCRHHGPQTLSQKSLKAISAFPAWDGGIMRDLAKSG